MKSHHVLFTLAMLTLGGAAIYEYCKHKKGGCHCGCGGKCKGSAAASNTTTAPATSTPAVATAVSTRSNPAQPVIPSTGLSSQDDMINPQSSWSNADGDNEGAIVDTVRHAVIRETPSGPAAVYMNQ